MDKNIVYADNAATTKLDINAFEAMKPYLLDDYGNPSQPYSFSRNPKQAIDEAREIIAECINAQPEEIFFTSGGTESDNWVLNGFGASGNKKIVITSPIEHHAVLNTCDALNKKGSIDLFLLEVNKEGKVLIDSMKQTISSLSFDTDRVDVLTSVMLANNGIGSIQDLAEISEEAHNAGAIVHTDAVQAIGHIPVNVKSLGIDYLSASAHKFNGPKGIGFLYKKTGISLQPYQIGGSQEHGLRAGTENVASIVGMAVALQINVKEIEKNIKKILHLEDLLLEDLKGIDFLHNGSKDHIPGNINLSFRNEDGERILHRLDLMGISVSTGSACDSVNSQLSHVIKAIKVDEEYAHGTIRISLGKYNTEEDVHVITNCIKKIIKRD